MQDLADSLHPILHVCQKSLWQTLCQVLQTSLSHLIFLAFYRNTHFERLGDFAQSTHATKAVELEQGHCDIQAQALNLMLCCFSTVSGESSDNPSWTDTQRLCLHCDLEEPRGPGESWSPFPAQVSASHPRVGHVPFFRTFHYSSPPSRSSEVWWKIGRFFSF